MEFNKQGNFKQVKSSRFNKQLDDFQGTFPNFMTLTEEEKKEFNQTLLAAKENLEKKGLTVWPQFGTIHDESWNSNALGIEMRKSIDNDFYISGVTTCAPEVKIPTNFRYNISTDEPYPAHLNLPSREPKKYFSNGELCTGFVSRESSEAKSVTSKSLENINFGKKHECKAIDKNQGRKNMTQRLGEHQDEVLKIKGKRLKVQVTVTSADNERIGKAFCKRAHLKNPAPVEEKKNSDEMPTNSKKIVIESEDTESSKSQTSEESSKSQTYEESIEDPELKDLLNIEKEESSDYNKDERESKKVTKEEKLRTETKNKTANKRKRVKSKINETSKPENVRFNIKKEEPPSVKHEGQQKSKGKSLLSGDFEWNLENLIVEKEKEKTFLGHTDSTVLIRRKQSKEKNTKMDVNEGSDYELNADDKSNALQNETSEPEKPVGTAQRVLSVTSLTGTDSSLSSVEKKTEKADRNLEKPKSIKQLQVKNREEHPLHKKCLVYTKKLKQHKEGLRDSGNEKLTEDGSSTNEEDPRESVIEQKGASGAYKKTINAPSTTKIKEEKKESSEAGKILDPFWKSCKTSREEKGNFVKRFESGYYEDAPKGGNPPLFKNGKVIFVGENVIEKIRNVIVDLERKAKAHRCDEEIEYLILLVEHIEYLSKVIENIIDNRTKNPTAENGFVKFDEENLSEIQKITPSMSERDFEPNEESETLEGLKESQRKKSKVLKFFRKVFLCGKKK